MDGLFSEPFPVLDPSSENGPEPERCRLPFWLCVAIAGPAAWSMCFAVVLFLRQESSLIPLSVALSLAIALGLVLGVIAIKSEKE